MNRTTASSFAVLAFLAGLLSFTASSVLAAASDEMLGSTFRIRYERHENGSLITGHGTAFGVNLTPYGVNSQRMMLSAAHNVLDDRNQPFTTLKIEINEGSRSYWTSCRVVAFDKEMDICLLESSDTLPGLTTLGDCDLQPGNRVVLAGSPRGVPVALYEGEVLRRFESGSIRTSARVVFDHGDSGGPFFCARTNKVIGVAVAGVPRNGDMDHNIGLFVPLAGIDSFLLANIPNAHSRNRATVAARSEPITATQNANSESVVLPAAKSVAVAPRAEIVKTEEPVAPAKIEAPAAMAVIEAPQHKPVVSIAYAPTPQAPVAPKIAPSIAIEAPAAIVSLPEHVAVKAAPKSEVAHIAASDLVFVDPSSLKSKVYIVKSGDMLSRIARDNKVSMNDLVSANNIKDPNLITVGMKVLIPAQ